MLLVEHPRRTLLLHFHKIPIASHGRQWENARLRKEVTSSQLGNSAARRRLTDEAEASHET